MAKKINRINAYFGEGGNGGCFFQIADGDKPQHVLLRVGWSCVIVHDDDKEIPVTWLAEVISIATSHKGGIVGFLEEHNQEYALVCDPPKESTK